MEDNNAKSKFEETIRVTGETLVDTIKKLLHEGNIRRVIIKDDTGKTLFDFPMTFGVLGALISAPLTALATLVVLFKEYTITVERTEESKEIDVTE